MKDEAKKDSYEAIVDPNKPDKVTLVIDPFSKPVELAKDVTNAVVKGGKKTVKAIKGIFK